jgi:hypothetical protein
MLQDPSIVFGNLVKFGIGWVGIVYNIVMMVQVRFKTRYDFAKCGMLCTCCFLTQLTDFLGNAALRYVRGCQACQSSPGSGCRASAEGPK